jgi:hypothetical protein
MFVSNGDFYGVSPDPDVVKALPINVETGLPFVSSPDDGSSWMDID